MDGSSTDSLSDARNVIYRMLELTGKLSHEEQISPDEAGWSKSRSDFCDRDGDARTREGRMCADERWAGGTRYRNRNTCEIFEETGDLTTDWGSDAHDDVRRLL